MNKKSSIHGITTNILRKAFEIIGDSFLHLVNISIEYGSFPKSSKVSTPIPIEKNGFILTEYLASFRKDNSGKSTLTTVLDICDMKMSQMTV